MLFLGRILIILAVLGGLGYAALFALATFVEPEQRDIVITIPTPKSPRVPAPVPSSPQPRP